MSYFSGIIRPASKPSILIPYIRSYFSRIIYFSISSWDFNLVWIHFKYYSRSEKQKSKSLNLTKDLNWIKFFCITFTSTRKLWIFEVDILSSRVWIGLHTCIADTVDFNVFPSGKLFPIQKNILRKIGFALLSAFMSIKTLF